MADIFISYARADAAHVEPLAQALTEQGWSVWWDRSIIPGSTFDDVIEAELNAARCVIVVWSQAPCARTGCATRPRKGSGAAF